MPGRAGPAWALCLQGWQRVRSPAMPGLAFNNHESQKSHWQSRVGVALCLTAPVLPFPLLPQRPATPPSSAGICTACPQPHASTALLQPPVGQETKSPAPSWHRETQARHASPRVSAEHNQGNLHRLSTPPALHRPCRHPHPNPEGWFGVSLDASISHSALTSSASTKRSLRTADTPG